MKKTEEEVETQWGQPEIKGGMVAVSMFQTKGETKSRQVRLNTNDLTEEWQSKTLNMEVIDGAELLLIAFHGNPRAVVDVRGIQIVGIEGGEATEAPETVQAPQE